MERIYICGILLWGALSPFANAQGVNDNLSGVKSMSLGGAATVYVKDASSVYHNPAIPALFETNMATAGLGFVASKTSFLNSEININQETVTKPRYMPFHGYGSYRINDQMVASLGINTPFGISRKWDSDWIGRYIAQEFRLRTLSFQPTFSYLIRDDLAVGGGPVITVSKFMYNHVMDFQDITAKVRGNDVGLGFNAGVWGKISEGTEYGATFKLPTKLRYKNAEAQLGNIPSLMSNQITTNEDVVMMFMVPYQISLALSNRIMEHIYLTYQFDLYGWKPNKSLDFNYKNENIPDVSFIKNYRNSLVFRVGGEYVLNEFIKFRGGFFYKETPLHDEYLSPDFPDGSTLGFSTGFSYIMNENISFDAAFNYDNIAKRDVLNSHHNFSGIYKTLNYGFLIGANYNF